MIILSFNVRGLGGAHKRLIQSINLDIILLRETMCYVAKAKSTLEAWLKNWDFCALNVDGMSGGLIMGWGSTCKSLSSSSFHSSTSIKLMIKDFRFSFSVLNIYGPYADRIPFWEDLAYVGAFIDPLFIWEMISNLLFPIEKYGMRV
jgi:hypothetical protein